MLTCEYCGITDTFVTMDGWQSVQCDRPISRGCTYREGIRVRHDDAERATDAWEGSASY